MARPEKFDSAIRAKLRLKELVEVDRGGSKDDLNKKPVSPKSKDPITKTLSLDGLTAKESDEPEGIVRLDNEPEDKL